MPDLSEGAAAPRCDRGTRAYSVTVVGAASRTGSDFHSSSSPAGSSDARPQRRNVHTSPMPASSRVANTTPRVSASEAQTGLPPSSL